MSICLHVHMFIWTFRHLDPRTCCHDAGYDTIYTTVVLTVYDYKHLNVLKTLTGNNQNISIKKPWENCQSF